MRDRQPVYETVRRNMYPPHLKPKRMQRDDIDVCNCAAVAPAAVPADGEAAVVREVSAEPQALRLSLAGVRFRYEP